LKGFNLTDQLLRKLFSELDPHKKGFLAKSDWVQAFSGFDWQNQTLVEVENMIGCSFSDMDSAFAYYMGFSSKKKVIDKHAFRCGTNSLLGKKLKPEQSEYLWTFISKGDSSISYDDF
jgi:Ca2+-binding EF-hand superfamily protein